jgi:hypothetical protein
LHRAPDSQQRALSVAAAVALRRFSDTQPACVRAAPLLLPVDCRRGANERRRAGNGDAGNAKSTVPGRPEPGARRIERTSVRTDKDDRRSARRTTALSPLFQRRLKKERKPGRTKEPVGGADSTIASPAWRQTFHADRSFRRETCPIGHAFAPVLILMIVSLPLLDRRRVGAINVFLTC